MPYTCPHCERVLHREKTFKQHVISCQYLSSMSSSTMVKIMEDDPTPTSDKLYLCIKHLMEKCETLEQELNVIKKRDFKRSTMPILEWLNSSHFNPPSKMIQIKSIYIWIDEFELDMKLFERLIGQSKNHEVMILNTFQEILTMEEEEYHPLVGFEQNVNALYTFNENNLKWSELTLEEWNQIVSTLRKRLVKKFNEWVVNQGDEVFENEELVKQYDHYSSIVIGSTDRSKSDIIMKRLYNQLYRYLKRTIKNIVGYEFEF